MKLRSRSGKLTAWEHQLRHANKELWAGDLAEAQEGFQSFIAKYRELLKRYDAAQIEPLYYQAKAGLWAIDYLRDGSNREKYRKAVHGRGNDVAVWSIVANAFYRQGDTSLPALSAYLTLLRLQPHASLGRRLAPLIVRAERSDRAMLLLQGLARLDPPDCDVLARLCQFYLDENRLSDAEEIANRILSENREHGFALRVLAFAAQSRGHWAQATTYYERAGDWADALEAAIYANDQTAAERVAKRVDVQTADPRTLRNVGWVHFLLGNVSRALEYWQTIADSHSAPENGDLAAWIQAINCLPTEPEKARRQLGELVQQEHIDQRIGADLVNVTKWLLSHPPNSAQTTDAARASDSSSLSSLWFTHEGSGLPLLPSYVLSILVSGETPNVDLLNQEHPSKFWYQVRAAAYVQQGAFDEALEALANHDAGKLGEKIRSLSLQGALVGKDTDTTIKVIRQIGPAALATDTGPTVRIAQKALWQENELDLLVSFLNTQLWKAPKNPTQLHHDLAIVLTKLAIARDTTAFDHSLWTRAMSHWAVALTDDEYWNHWQNDRASAYMQSVSANQMAYVRETGVPDLLRAYHNRHPDHSQPGEQALLPDRRYLAAFIQREIKLATAVRHVLAMAKAQKIELPPAVKILISPKLLKMHGDEDVIAGLLELLPRTKAPHLDQQLVREAFSELADVYVLEEAGNYEAALQQVRQLHKQEPRNPEVRNELLHIMRLQIRALADRSQWHEARSLGKEALQIQPGDSELERNLADATVGLAKQQNAEGKRLEAIHELQNTRNKLKHGHAELEATLCDLLTDHAVYLNDDVKDLEGALKYVQQALELDSQHVRARAMAAVVYHNRALQRLGAKRFNEAIIDARHAVQYEEDAVTYRILASALCELQKWTEASEAAQKSFDLDPSEERYDFWISTYCQRAISLATNQQYSSAIRIIEGLLDLPQPPSSINLQKLLSALHTDYGAALWNTSRDRYGAKRQWELALRYDPTNTTARNNLRVAGGTQW